MEQYIPKSALVAEIKRQISAIDNYPKITSTQTAVLEGNKVILTKLLSLIDNLEVKEVDLEKEIKEVQREYKTIEEYERYPATIYANDIEWIAKHFFELGLFSRLTWKDIRLISEIGEDFMNSEESDGLWKDEEVYYTAILNKLKEKGRDYKTERQITRELEQKGE